MKILEICFIKHLEKEDTLFDNKAMQKNIKSLFKLQNNYLKPKIDHKNK
jgi:hypothetical protein